MNRYIDDFKMTNAFIGRISIQAKYIDPLGIEVLWLREKSLVQGAKRVHFCRYFIVNLILYFF